MFDLVFSTARIPSGLITDELVEIDLCNTVSEALWLWRGLDMSVNPKCHALEDHLCDQMQCFGGIGDLGEDFIEQAHQDGIKDSRRTKNAKDWAMAAQWHSNWEHRRKNPLVLMKSEKVRLESVRGKYTKDDNAKAQFIPTTNTREEKKKHTDESKRNIRMEALEATTTNDGVYLKSGRKRSRDEVKEKILQQEAQKENIAS